MRFTLLLNAVPLIIAGQRMQDDGGSVTNQPIEMKSGPSVADSSHKRVHKSDKSEDADHEGIDGKDRGDSKKTDDAEPADDAVSPWQQYTEGDRNDWHKYLSKPGSNGTDDGTQFDWMKYAAPYMNMSGSNTSDNSTGGSFDWQQFAGKYMGGGSGDNSTSTQWNNGQGDGFGEPFRSQTGGDFRYKAGRQWDNSTSGGDGGFDWQKFAAPYSNVNPSQPGTETQASNSSAMDWHKYTSSGGNTGGGDFDWHQYADKYMSGGNGGQGSQQSSGNNDWQKYAAPYMGGESSSSSSSGQNPAAQIQAGPASGGYFEVEVSGTNLNVTTTFGLGQGRAANGTSNDSSAEAGGGGGQQTFMTADEGRIFLRGNFLNKLDPNVVPA